MSDPNEELPETNDAEITVDFDSPESRMTFLKTQLNDLLDGINNVYGQDLMEELLKRLEKTVEDYNGEVTGLIGKLKAGKIFDEEDSQAEYTPEPVVEVDHTDLDEDEPEKSFEDQESEDSDIIARMRARITHD